MFFKERRIKFQLINLAEKEMSRGELTSVLASVSLDELIDTNSKLGTTDNNEKLNIHILYFNIFKFSFLIFLSI